MVIITIKVLALETFMVTFVFLVMVIIIISTINKNMTIIKDIIINAILMAKIDIIIILLNMDQT